MAVNREEDKKKIGDIIKDGMSNIGDHLEDLKEKIEEKVLSVKDFFSYLHESFEYPERNYEIANKPRKLDYKPKKCILVLSGGGARGIAHIGVYRGLLEQGIRPSAVIGTSIGAIIGSFIAEGRSPDEMEKILVDNETALTDHIKPSMLSPEKFSAAAAGILSDNLKARRFSELAMPAHFNCADLCTGSRVIFSDGELIPAVLGSSAIPFLLKPVAQGEHLLVDGGAIDNFCLDLARSLPHDLIVVSDVSAATDPTSSVRRSYLSLKFSRSFMESTKLLGQKLYPIASESETLAYINNLVYMLLRRGSLSPDVSGEEVVVTPLLEKMAVFAFNEREFALEKGKSAVELVFGKVEEK